MNKSNNNSNNKSFSNKSFTVSKSKCIKSFLIDDIYDFTYWSFELLLKKHVSFWFKEIILDISIKYIGTNDPSIFLFLYNISSEHHFLLDNELNLSDESLRESIYFIILRVFQSKIGISIEIPQLYLNKKKSLEDIIHKYSKYNKNNFLCFSQSDSKLSLGFTSRILDATCNKDLYAILQILAELKIIDKKLEKKYFKCSPRFSKNLTAESTKIEYLIFENFMNFAKTVENDKDRLKIYKILQAIVEIFKISQNRQLIVVAFLIITRFSRNVTENITEEKLIEFKVKAETMICDMIVSSRKK